jgi:hypothetical protein
VKTFRVQPWGRAHGAFFALVFLCTFLLPFALKSLVFLSVLLPLMLLLGAAAFVRATIVVGDDGVLTRRLFSKQFIPFSNVARVSIVPEMLATTDKRGGKSLHFMGSQLMIETSEGPDVNLDVGTRPRELFDAIVDARRRWHGERLTTMMDPRSLGAFGGDARAWLSRLRALSQRTTNYRIDAPTDDALLALVEDPTSMEESRAAAAVVLAAAHDESIAERLLVARDASASPSLQQAIDAAIEGEDEAIARALDDIRSRR